MALLVACSGKSPTSDSGSASQRAEAEPDLKAEPEIQAPSDLPIAFGVVEVEGSRDGSTVLQAATAGQKDLVACYEKYREAKPDLVGKLALRILVTPEGKVTDALIHDNKLPDHRVGTCMLQVVEGWNLSPNDDPEPSRVVLPMVLGEPPSQAG